MAPPTVYTVRYYNSYNTAAVILYPMVTSQTDPSSRIWNGRDGPGQAWRQYDGNGLVVDLYENCDGKLTPGQSYYFAADVVGGHSPWLSDCLFQYDPNSTNVANVQWSGNSLDCGASFNGITTYPTVYDPDAVGGKMKLNAGERTYGQTNEGAAAAGGKPPLKQGQKATSVTG